MAYRRAGTARSTLLRAACMKVERAKSGFSPTFCFLDCHITTAQQKGKQIEIVNIIQAEEKTLQSNCISV
jgi:hypothetical protein